MWNIWKYVSLYLLITIHNVVCSNSISSGIHSVSQWDIQNDTIGRYNLLHGGHLMIANACPEFEYSNTGTRINLCDSKLYYLRKVPYPWRNWDNQLGNYTEYILDYAPVSNKLLPEVNCIFKIVDYPKHTVLIRMNLSKQIETNWISPMSQAQWSIQMDSKHTRILNIPPDNDLQSFYVSVTPSGITKDTSNYVTAFYEHGTESHKGLVVGFLEHTIFKTGIEFTDQMITAVAGANGELLTRDRIPHGIVNVSYSPWLLVHMNYDWRLGMEVYADMIAQSSPQSASIHTLAGTAPIASWNSWAMAVGHIGQPNKTNLFAASDVLENLTSSHFGPRQYIVRDAVYNLNQSITNQWISHVHSYTNQHTGTYSSPTVLYQKSQTADYYVNCDDEYCTPGTHTSHCYLFNDIILKDKSGQPILPLNELLLKSSKRILDVTHPITSCMLQNRSQQIKHNNMSLVKYDFLNYAAFEGHHYNQTIARTGMQAYTYLLSLIDKVWNQTVILNYGISLPFPVGAGMTIRRHTCDQMYGGVAYSMNSYTYGWWLSRLYMLNPDMIAFQEDYWFNPPLSKITKQFAMDYTSRVSKAVVVGGLYESGDDLSNATNVKLVQTYIGNPRVNTMWSRSKVGYPETMFRPVIQSSRVDIPLLSSVQPASIYIRQNGDIAIFNFGLFVKTFFINISQEIHTFNNKTITCVDIWTNQIRDMVNPNILKYTVPKTSSVLLECRPGNHS